MLMTTVEDNTSEYTIRAYLSSIKASELQKIKGRTSSKYLINYRDRNMIMNCPVAIQDILRGEDTFGSSWFTEMRNSTYHT